MTAPKLTKAQREVLEHIVSVKRAVTVGPGFERVSCSTACALARKGFVHIGEWRSEEPDRYTRGWGMTITDAGRAALEEES